jgi:hypothetical protein
VKKGIQGSNSSQFFKILVLQKKKALDDITLQTHKNIMNGIRVIEKGPYSSAEYISRPSEFFEANCFKKLVSKKKIRY